MSTDQLRKTDIISRSLRRPNRWLSAVIIIVVIDLVVAMFNWSYPEPPNIKNAVTIGNLDGAQLLHWGANYAPYTWTGQYWRLLTSLFVHVSVRHLTWNIAFVLLLAFPIENLYGRGKVAVLYVSSGFAGWLLSMGWHPIVAACGSSGAIDGLAGFLISLIAFNRNLLSRRRAAILLFLAGSAIVLTLMAGRQSKAVDNAAHIGGLLFGLILGACFASAACSDVLRRSVAEWRILMFATLTLVGLLIVLISVRKDVVELGRGERASDRNDFVGAVPHLQRFVLKNPADLIGHSDLGYAYLNLNRNEEAAQEYRHILELDPDNPVAEFDLALIYTVNDPERAIPLYRTSLPRLPKNSDRYYDFAIALHKAGNLEEAHTVALKALSLDPHSELKQGLYISIGTEIARQKIATERAQQRKE